MIDKFEAERLTGVSWQTLNQMRRSGELISGTHFVEISPRKFRYNKVMLLDYFLTRNDNPQGHREACEKFRASMPSNQRKRG